MVILVTGKAGAGKTTYATRLARELIQSGRGAVVIDSDEVRNNRKNFDYSDKGRLDHLLHLAQIARTVEATGSVAIVSAISPRKCWRDQMRECWTEHKTIYIPGGSIWVGTSYELPSLDEI